MTTDGDRDPDSILGNLQGDPISYEQAEAFDATIDRLNRVITYLTGRMAELEGKSDASPDELAALSARRDHYITERNALKPEDAQHVAHLRQECVRILRDEAGY